MSHERDEFEQLALPLLPALYNFARWLAHDAAEADDLVQETFAKALRGFASFTRGTDFRAWMFRILRNSFLTSRTALATRMTEQLDLEEELPPATVEWQTPESIALAAATAAGVQAAIAQLPPLFREVVLLCDLEEMPYQQIAAVLSIPVGTVMSRLSRARKRLRELLNATSPKPEAASVASQGMAGAERQEIQ